MLSRDILPAPKGALSLHQVLELCNIYLEGAFKTTDRDIGLLLCRDAEAALSRAKSAQKSFPEHLKDAKYHTLRSGIAAAYVDLGKLITFLGYADVADSIRNKTVKWGGTVQDPGRLAQSFIPGFIASDSLGNTLATGPVDPSSVIQKKRVVVATVPSHIFATNIQPPSIDINLPEPDERLIDTAQLACCLGLIQTVRSSTDTLDPRVYKWLQTAEKDTDEQERLHTMASGVIRAFKRDELKDAKAIAEVLYLAPVLNKDPFQDILRDFYSAIDQSGLLDTYRVEGLAQLIQSADSGYLDADDLIKILELLSTRLRDTHQQSTHHMRQLTLTVSHVLDAMAETQVKGVDREKIHEPLMKYLNELKKSSDPFLVYQAAYAYQALLCVPDDETLWQATLRRTGKVIKGLSNLVSAVKSVDLGEFMDGLENIQKGLSGASEIVEIAFTAYKDVKELGQSGQQLFNCLKEGLSFKRKSAWYPALRGADTLIRRGELATFRKLVCEAPCRYNAAFQWGVCQRLGEMAANPSWDAMTRRGAIEFLGEIYKTDNMWGQHESVKQWILNILMQLASTPGSGSSRSSGETLQLHSIVAGELLQDLEECNDIKKQDLYRESRKNGPITYPLKISFPELGHPSLLDRVQNRPDVESSLRMLRRQRTKERGIAVYVQPQAKNSMHDSDDARFPLMESIKEFLDSERKVFLLLGESGAGKSTFSRELEFQLWQSYTKKTGCIPLHINLPTIDKPKHDMISKQLRMHEFTEPQIREMKHYRKFILICDGYDESQQTRNLYMSNNLNQPEEWDAQMVISCRSGYLGSDYRGRFQPGDRNTHLDSLFQEAVIAPFSHGQVNAYIEQYVLTQQPLWRVEDYKQALELIPSLKDLVQNPFMMALSLEVLPRMVEPGQDLSSTRVTRVGLYDHFVEQWLERNKKRLGEKDLGPQAKEVFELLSAEGFMMNGIEYLKRLAVAIYKEQDGHPVVTYSQLIDEGSWKDALFKEKHKQLLLEACPVTRNGSQHRFIHRSVLEYGLARAVFDPEDVGNRTASESISDRRGSASSILGDHDMGDQAIAAKEPDRNSPLVWRSFTKDHSLLQFLEERVQLEPVFKEQLLTYIEYSKRDRKWRKAGTNAITILVRAGVQFIGADLQGIQVPGADLSFGMFDSAQLQEADLRNVNLRGAWLCGADLSRANMSGAQFGELPYLPQDSPAYSCRYSPDGTSFVTGLVRGDICVYTSNWDRVHTLRGHTNAVGCIRFSPKGDQIASGSNDGTVRLWDIEEGTCQQILTHTSQVSCIAYLHYGDGIMSACIDGTLRLWKLDTGECILTLTGHTDAVISVDISPDGTEMASGSSDSTIRLWDLGTGACTHVLSGHRDRVWSVAFSPRGDRLASASFDRTVQLWDVSTGACLHVLTGHNQPVFCVTFSPKGDMVASGGGDGMVRLWDAETGTNRHIFRGHSHVVIGVAYSPQGDQIASGSYDKTVRLWDVSAVGARNFTGGHTHDVYGVDYSPQRHLIASASRDYTIRLWDADTGSRHQTLNGHTDTVSRVAFSPTGDTIASSGLDKSIRLWDVETGICQRVWNDHNDWVYEVAFSPQGHLLASASKDKTVRLWDVETGSCHAVLIGHLDDVMCVKYSADGTMIASGSKDNTIRLWDAETLDCLQTLRGHDSELRQVAFSPNGTQLASASNDNTVRLWNVGTGDCQFVLTDHSGCVYSVSYSLNGHLLASGSGDKTMRLWDVTLGECRAVAQHFEGAVRGVRWVTTSDADYVITGAEGGSVVMWKVTAQEDQYRVSLQCGALQGKLTIAGLSIQNTCGLSRDNKELLKQRGAVGEPED